MSDLCCKCGDPSYNHTDRHVFMGSPFTDSYTPQDLSNDFALYRREERKILQTTGAATAVDILEELKRLKRTEAAAKSLAREVAAILSVHRLGMGEVTSPTNVVAMEHWVYEVEKTL